MVFSAFLCRTSFPSKVVHLFIDSSSCIDSSFWFDCFAFLINLLSIDSVVFSYLLYQFYPSPLSFLFFKMVLQSRRDYLGSTYQVHVSLQCLIFLSSFSSTIFPSPVLFFLIGVTLLSAMVHEVLKAVWIILFFYYFFLCALGRHLISLFRTINTLLSFSLSCSLFHHLVSMEHLPLLPVGLWRFLVLGFLSLSLVTIFCTALFFLVLDLLCVSLPPLFPLVFSHCSTIVCITTERFVGGLTWFLCTWFPSYLPPALYHPPPLNQSRREYPWTFDLPSLFSKTTSSDQVGKLPVIIYHPFTLRPSF